jgi:16S rRNA processing protein RimM
MTMTSKDSNLVMLAQITAPHGVRGLVKLRSFTEKPDDALSYGPLSDAKGLEYRVIFKSRKKGGLVVAVDGCNDRDAAEKLRGLKLHVPRSALPAEDGEDEFYQTDLIGLQVADAVGREYGSIRAVQNFGAGDMLEVVLKDSGKTVLVPFTLDHVPEVDVAGGKVLIADVDTLFDQKGGKDDGNDEPG